MKSNLYKTNYFQRILIYKMLKPNRPVIVVPYFNGPVGRAGNVDVLVEGVPLDAVHGHVVGPVCVQVLS